MKIPLAKLLVLLWMHLRETLSHLNSSPTLTMNGRWDVVVERKEDWVENLPSVLLSERETTWRRRLSEERDQDFFFPTSYPPTRIHSNHELSSGSIGNASQ